MAAAGNAISCLPPMLIDSYITAVGSPPPIMYVVGLLTKNPSLFWTATHSDPSFLAGKAYNYILPFISPRPAPQEGKA